MNTASLMQSPMIMASGQAASIVGAPTGATVEINGAVVAANADGSYPVPAGQQVSLVIKQGATVVATRAVTAAQGQTVVVDLRPSYAFGSEDYYKNEAAKRAMIGGLVGIGTILAFIIGLATALMRDKA